MSNLLKLTKDCIPVYISLLITAISSAIDTIVLGNYSQIELIDVSICLSIYTPVLVILTVSTKSIVPLLNKLKLSCEKLHLLKVFNVFYIYLSLFVFLFLFLFQKSIFDLLAIKLNSNNYYNVILFCLILNTVTSIQSSYLIVTQKSNINKIFKVTWQSFLLNTGLTYFLVNGVFLLKPMGSLGAAIATVIANLVVMLRLCKLNKFDISFNPRLIFDNLNLIKTILRRSLFFPIGMGMKMIFFSAITLFLSKTEKIAIPTHTCLMNIALIINSFGVALVLANNKNITEAVASGAGNFKNIVTDIFLACLFYAAAACFFVFLFFDNIMRVYNLNIHLLSINKVLYISCLLFDTLHIAFGTMLYNLNVIKRSLLFMFFSYLFLPCCILFINKKLNVIDSNFALAWFCLLCSYFSSFLISSFRIYLFGKNKYEALV